MAQTRASEHRGAILVSSLILARVLLAGLFWFTYTRDMIAWALVSVAVTFGTDVLDGRLSRKLHVSPLGSPYLDALADFVFVSVAFSVFVSKGEHPMWILALVGVMFLQFILTSGLKRPIYDPIGKYYGAFLFVAIGVSTAFSLEWVQRALQVMIVGFTAISLASRLAFLRRRPTAAVADDSAPGERSS